MKTILILSNSMRWHGLLRRELTKNLAADGYNVVLALPVDDKEHPFNEYVVIDTFINRRGMNPFQDLKLVFKYISILKKTKPDVVLTYAIKPNLYGGLACRLLKIPYMPNVTGLGSGVHKKGFVNKIVRFLSKMVFRKARAVFIQNKDILEYLHVINALSDNAVLIPGSGVNLEKYTLLDYPPPKAAVTFNFIGRIMKEKGIDEYLEAARRIKKKYPDTVFNVIGFLEESEYSSIIQSAHNENIICFHGFQPDMLPFLQSGHCTVNPSYHEGMSNVLLESSACGRAVIASDISGCREITDDGVTGFLCEAKNAEDLADKLEKFIMLSYDEKVQMGLRGHEKMQREFDRNIVIKAYMKEIKKITGETNEQSDR